MTAIVGRPLFAGDLPMRVAVLTSGSGGNLRAVARTAGRRPDVLELALVASDRPNCGAVAFAAANRIPLVARDFTAECGHASEARSARERAAYAARAAGFHDRLDEAVERVERDRGPIDVLVLAYGRWVHGRMLDRWRGRMVNQHPGDLRVLDRTGRRALVGNNPVLAALRQGHRFVRTSTFLVDEGHDTGGIIAQGPSVPTTGVAATQAAADALEQVQKARSDWPVLAAALIAIARARLAVDPSRRGPDGSPCFTVLDEPLPFGGLDLDRPEALARGLDQAPEIMDVADAARHEMQR